MCDDAFRSLEAVRREAEAERLARAILGVGPAASAEEIKRAWREACLRTHPDRNPRDPDAPRKFRTVNCAYAILTGGRPCGDLADAAAPVQDSLDHDKSGYNLDTAWGHFLWWRDRFFH